MRLKSELVPSVNSSSPRDVVAGGAGSGGVSPGVESCASPSSSSCLAGGRQPRSKMCLAAKRAGLEGMRSHPFQVMHDGPGPVGDRMLFCMGRSGTSCPRASTTGTQFTCSAPNRSFRHADILPSGCRCCPGLEECRAGSLAWQPAASIGWPRGG